MPSTVYAENMGFFHKGSGGKGVAPGDVCLTPPPPPTGPVPVPYVNVLQATNLTKGSKTVRVDGKPTALEDQSFVSTSTGDEAGTQGGNVVTHKTKGKGYFKLWSFTVFVEGKGVARHGDPMGQNCGSLAGAVDFAAVVKFHVLLKTKGPCPPGSKPPKHPGTNAKQQQKVKGGPCWQCGATDSGYAGRKRKGGHHYKKGEYFTPDHQPPRKRAWYMGGCHASSDDWKTWEDSAGAVVPHCKKCSPVQGGRLSRASIDDVLDFNNVY